MPHVSEAIWMVIFALNKFLWSENEYCFLASYLRCHLMETIKYKSCSVCINWRVPLFKSKIKALKNNFATSCRTLTQFILCGTHAELNV